MPEIHANGVSLYYEEHGAGEPILGLHGAGSSAAMWADAAPELGRHGRTILYDRRVEYGVLGGDEQRRLNRMAAAMPSATVEWVEGCHAINPAHPVVLGFLDEVLARQ